MLARGTTLRVQHGRHHKAPPLSKAPAPRVLHTLASALKEGGIGTQPRTPRRTQARRLQPRATHTPAAGAIAEAKALHRESVRLYRAGHRIEAMALNKRARASIGLDPTGYAVDPVQAVKLTTGMDLARLVHPVRALQHDARGSRAIAEAYRRGEITREQA